ncbi:rod shape-determining protein MreD [Sphingomonadaceae bacterium G21617-S1]|jgi:rod shape-determining protein MreD|uniref:rod shape-determining protein MreD n=1 Tax=Rhizorhabdus sp. TaxID=1968843 RepID=UPI0012014818|nr:rod shape-determining protein MreD [Rhizorhabdus sp.]MBD3761951.1 rod shape-determining protein MreD [Rhizorhabdus sp.]MCZ4343282.1 rod shape-determining protein MreD [Sphingomonadaceae bacterium G21617-S1]TAK06744.1 MAG: rod shape-determining protein MreD [Rhizorhabdus sp.]
MIARRGNPYMERSALRVTLIPVLSVLAGSAMALVPVIATEPIVPPFGLMMLLAWRLLRPEIWPVWAALPLGLADDLMSGHYLGTAMILWTVAFLVLEWVDQLLLWREGWIEWAIAAVALPALGVGAWALSQPGDSHTSVLTILPQTIGAVLLFPAILRLTAALDTWRLKR